MRIGFVSDERYRALADVSVEFDRDGESVTARSSARGAIDAELEPGVWRVTLARDGYGAKRSTIAIPDEAPKQFRLLSDTLYGYVWPKWCRAGDSAEFRVHSCAPYRIGLWRYGQERELIRPLGWFDEHGPDATRQLLPDGDFVSGGVEWNRIGWGSSHHAQKVAAPARSGLYGFLVENERGERTVFPWVVAPIRPGARIAVVASTNTWNAYNRFGGRSNYINAAGLPAEPTVNARQDLSRYLRGGAYDEWASPDDAYAPLSFDRPEPGNTLPGDGGPMDPIVGRDSCHQASAEWRLLSWLEREGFAYDLYSDAQLHAGELDLYAYRTLILSTHPEYWTTEMYWRVKQWVFLQGGRMLYLGGNGLNCEAELLDDKTLRCKSHVFGLSGWGQPESRFARTVESEASLLGVVTTDAGIMTAAPYRVVEGGHWVYIGTGLREGSLFGQRSLHERVPGGASGHETDKRSPSSPGATLLLAKGTNPDNGGAEMVLHETAHGGAVFSVGSITWPSSILVDPNISRITRNVLERFLGD